MTAPKPLPSSAVTPISSDKPTPLSPPQPLSRSRFSSLASPYTGAKSPTSPSPGRVKSPLTPPSVISLRPSKKHQKEPSRSRKVFQRVRNVIRSFPIIVPACKMPVQHGNRPPDYGGHIKGGTRMTGTLFGYRKSRVNLAIQDTPSSLPVLLLELAIPTGKLMHDMGQGFVRMALECEKKPNSGEKTKIMDEPIWVVYCNGRKCGYGVKREATEEDLGLMQMLHGVSMGAGVLPSDDNENGDGDVAYMRAQFDRVVGSRDSETYYMVTPDGNNDDGPELSIFFVRV